MATAPRRSNDSFKVVLLGEVGSLTFCYWSLFCCLLGKSRKDFVNVAVRWKQVQWRSHNDFTSKYNHVQLFWKTYLFLLFKNLRPHFSRNVSQILLLVLLSGILRDKNDFMPWDRCIIEMRMVHCWYTTLPILTLLIELKNGSQNCIRF